MQILLCFIHIILQHFFERGFSTMRNNKTYLALMNCTKRNGEPYIGFVAEAPAIDIRPMKKIGENGNVVDFKVPLRGVSNYIANFTGLEPTEDEDGLIIARASAWGRAAYRLDNLVKSPGCYGKQIAPVITGSFKVESRTDANGVVKNVVKLSISSFNPHVYTIKADDEPVATEETEPETKTDAETDADVEVEVEVENTAESKDEAYSEEEVA